MKSILLILFACLVNIAVGQNISLYDTYGIYPAPWSAWQKAAVSFISINVVVDSVEKKVIESEPEILLEDLMNMYHEYPLEVLNIQRRGHIFQIKRPGQAYPMFRNYTIQKASDCLSDYLPFLYDGWSVELKQGGFRKASWTSLEFPWAEKNLPNGLTVLSTCMCLRRIYP